MGVASETATISAIYEKGDKKDFKNYRSILLLNLDYKIYTKILKESNAKNITKYNNRRKPVSCYYI